MTVLERLAAEYALGLVDVDSLRERATELVAAGVEAPSLVRLAGAEKHEHPADLRALFTAGLAEAGAPVPDEAAAIEPLARAYARDVIEDRCDVLDGGRCLAKLEARPYRHAGDVTAIAEVLGDLWFDGGSTSTRDAEHVVRAACMRIAPEPDPPPPPRTAAPRAAHPNRRIGEAWVAAVNARDVDARVALYAADATHTSPKIRALHPDTGGKLVGKAALAAWWRESHERIAGLRYETTSVTADDARVIVEYVRHAEGQAPMPVSESFDVVDGLVVSSRVHHG
jgi:limonene-1,2-epoxide hydrolase